MELPTTEYDPLTHGTGAQFHDTRWTVVLAAIDSPSPALDAALAKLCRAYWYPLYAFARRSGLSQADAADATQSFFAQLLEKGSLKKVDRNKGRFRSFLLASLKNFLHNEWDKAHAQKRGGTHELLSLDEMAAEERYQQEPADQTSPEQLYDRQWAVALTREVMEELKACYAKAGKAELFETLQPYLTAEMADGQLKEMATRLAMNPNTLKSALHRLRREEFGTLLREQVRHTLASPTEQEVREEIRHLFASIGT